MKKLFLIGLTLISFNSFAQDLDFGVKAGAVFNADKGVLKTIGEVRETKGETSTGFQAGVMMRAKFMGFYVQPELLYTNYKNEFEVNGLTGEVKKSRVDVPINVGKTFAMGLVQIQTGPVFSFNSKEEFDGENVKIEADEQDKVTMGWQVGTGLNFKNFNVDLRYEFGLNKNTTEYLSDTALGGFQTENRSSMLNLSVGYFF